MQSSASLGGNQRFFRRCISVVSHRENLFSPSVTHYIFKARTLGKLVGEMVIIFLLNCYYPGQASFHIYGSSRLLSWHDCSLPLFSYWVNFAFSSKAHFSLLWDRRHIGESSEPAMAPFLTFVSFCLNVYHLRSKKDLSVFSTLSKLQLSWWSWRKRRQDVEALSHERLIEGGSSRGIAASPGVRPILTLFLC